MRAAAGALAALVPVATAATAATAATPLPAPITITVHRDRVVRGFRPDRALGAGLDGHERGDTRLIYTARNLRLMGSAGLGPMSYRLRTELGVAAWHWNPRGSFSDARRHQGYWTSTPWAGRPIRTSYGYALPRRGDTIDQAEADGWSRLDDGSRRTFWKSNPYLDAHYLRAEHPQWALVDLGRPRPVDALRVWWGTPFATRFRVQWWTGPSAIVLAGHPPGVWRDFPRAGARRGRGGVQTVSLAGRAQRVRFVRIVLERSSHTAPASSRDVRDRLGYAIRELGLGTLHGRRFADLVRHGHPAQRQTVTMTSSTDPWHRARDINRMYEQPGLDRILRSGLTHHLPVLLPVAVLYGTPADAANELRWLRARRVPLRGIELGEEPDGQLASPEDYGALYSLFARALRRVDRHVVLGGPGFQTSIPDWLAWPDAHGDRSWTHRFLAELRRRGAMQDLGFFSFEWYPFDNVCAPPAPQLARAPDMLTNLLARQRAHGLPASVPEIITEYGYSAFAGRAEVDLPGAVLDADIAGRFLQAGGATAYLYGIEPDQLIRELSACDTWGNLTLFRGDSSRRVRQPVASYWAIRLLTQRWTIPGHGLHALLAADVPGSPHAHVSAYPVRRPDGRIAVLLINRDVRRTRSVTLAGVAPGPLETWTLSSASYVWHPHGAGGFAKPDAPPVHGVSSDGNVTLPPLSVAVALTR